jgi:hypothetical protein
LRGIFIFGDATGDDLNSTLESYLINFIGKLSILSINKEATVEARRAEDQFYQQWGIFIS